MDFSPSHRRHGRIMALIGVILLVTAGSLGLAGPAAADPSSQGQSHGQGHASKGDAHAAKGGKHQTTPRRSSSNHVSLPRPNDFQAQADPDGMENGGVDQPGGQGGIDPTSQDGNNGSGNDADCEDDNRGQGIPGHCKDRAQTPPVTEPGDDLPDDTTDEVSEEVPDTEAPVVSPPAAVAGPILPAVAPSTAEVSAAASSTDLISAGTSAPPAGVLPDTGAGQALLGLALAGLAALGVGGGLLLRRRPAAGRL